MKLTNDNHSMISATNLVVGYKEACTYPLTFTVNQPGIYALTGQNGSGKSTLLKTIVGLIDPVSGEIQIERHKKIAYIPQIHSVNKYLHLSMEDFILQGYGPDLPITAERLKEAENCMQEWQLAHSKLKCFHELSGGEKTRGMIIRALISKPDVIFLDEPLANLDSCCQEQLMNELAKLCQQKNVTVFIADHHLKSFQHLINYWFVFEKKHSDPLTYIRCGISS